MESCFHADDQLCSAMATSTHLRRLPDFLIIGAMKAGTTTLFADLRTQRQIFFPNRKEPNNLCSDHVLSDEGSFRYSQLFRDAQPHQLCGEASTSYSKLPVFAGVTNRARELLRPDLKIVYSVREPVARTLSHHRHQYLAGKAPADFEEYLRQGDRPINVSRYAMQIEPWIEAFGRQQVHFIQLEAYGRDRHRGLADLCRFLGIYDPRPELIDKNRIYHASKGKVPLWLLVPRLDRITRSNWCRRALLSLIPRPLVWTLKRTIVKRPRLPATPGAAVIDRIIDAVREDAERLRQIMGRDEPLWDFEAVRKKYVDAEQLPPFSGRKR